MISGLIFFLLGYFVLGWVERVLFIFFFQGSQAFRQNYLLLSAILACDSNFIKAQSRRSNCSGWQLCRRDYLLVKAWQT